VPAGVAWRRRELRAAEEDAMSDATTVLYEVSGSVATLTLHRPELFNALSAQLHADLLAALRRAEHDEAVRCLILTGSGKAFCSGQDLRELSGESVVELIGERLRESYNPLVLLLRELPKPVIAAINGVAAGAGLSLALACDLRVAAAGARLVVAFARIGLVPDCGMSYTLPRLIGPARAFELAARGGELDAATALSWGMLNQVVPDDQLLTAARALAEELARGPATAIGLIKRSLEQSQHASLAQALELEAQAQELAGAHPDFAEGVAAFREKRPTRFG
jgi:2-(1,2-epoxy-1,2-dihydrophenyl)acetyl-CoA isomerase